TERERLIAGFDGGEAVRGAEVAWKRKDGKPILVRLSARAVRRADGRIECFETIAEDITERRALEEQLRQSQKMEAIGQLTGGIVADLSGLLRRILPADVEVVIAGGVGLPEVRADVHAVEQILFNLATNARDAMPNGGVLRIETTRVELTEERRLACGAPALGEYGCLYVGDT